MRILTAINLYKYRINFRRSFIMNCNRHLQFIDHYFNKNETFIIIFLHALKAAMTVFKKN